MSFTRKKSAGLVQLAIELFLLHEVRHSSQGVGNYADVQRIKIRSETLVGQFDLNADRDAAHGYALLRAIDERASDVETYLKYFSEALFFMGQYCFPAFKIPLSKPHKVTRALGLTLMLVRYILADRDNAVLKVHCAHLPLDAVLVPELSADWGRLTLFAYSPDHELVAIDCEVIRIKLVAFASASTVANLKPCSKMPFGYCAEFRSFDRTQLLPVAAEFRHRRQQQIGGRSGWWIVLWSGCEDVLFRRSIYSIAELLGCRQIFLSVEILVVRIIFRLFEPQHNHRITVSLPNNLLIQFWSGSFALDPDPMIGQTLFYVCNHANRRNS